MSRKIVAFASLLSLAALVAVAGCGGTRSCRQGTYRITVDYSAVPSADQLRVTAAIEGGKTLTGTFAKPSGTKGTVEVDFGSAYPTGKSVTLTVDALAGGVPIASQTQAVTAPSGCDALNISFGGGAGGDGGVINTGDITITPGAPSVKAGAKLTFMADEAVDWTVSEGDSGGTISSAGVYTAPVKTGTYHVIATSRADANKKGTAVVTVVAWVLDVVAGKPGGGGTADGIGPGARFSGPSGGPAYDNGKLYVADGVSTIRQIDLTTKAVTTIAGVPTPYPGAYADGTGTDARFAYPWGLAVYKNYLYVTDGGSLSHNMIRRIDLTTHEVKTVAGANQQSGTVDNQYGFAARFKDAEGIVSDGAGHLLIADYGSGTIRALDLTGPTEAQPNYTVTTFSNSGASYTNPIGVTWDSGSLYYTMWQGANQEISKVTFTSGPGQFGQANNGAPVGAGALITGSGGTVVSASFISAVAVYQGKVYYNYGNGNGVVAYVTPGTTSPFTLAGGAMYQSDGSYSGAGFTNRYSLVSDGAGKLYVADGCCVRQINIADSSVSTPFGQLPSFASTDGLGKLASFTRPNTVAFDGMDTAWVLDGNGSQFTLRQVQISTGNVTTIGTSMALGYVGNLTYDGHGHLYVTASDSDGVSWGVLSIATADGTVGTVVPRANSPRTVGLVADTSGHLFATRTNTIIKIDTTVMPATTSVVAGTSGTKGTTDSPALFGTAQALAWDGADLLWVADDAAIRSVSISTGTTTTVAGVAGTKGTSDGTGNAARFLGPNALAVDGSIVYIVDSSQIRRLDATTGVVTQWVGVAGSAGLQPGALPAMVNGPRSMVSMGGGSLLLIDEYALARVH